MTGRLVVFGGLPGVGKSTLCREVARRLPATWVRVDALEAAMWQGGIDRAQPTGLAAYAVAHAVAEAQLALGQDVLIDAVNPVEAARDGWRGLADRLGAALRFVEVICSDPTEHRRRVEARHPEFGPGLHPTWHQVRDRHYEPWTGPRLTIDTVHDPKSNIRRILDDLDRAGGDECAASTSS